MKSLDISDVARRSGVKPSALRYYEDLGLIQSDGRKGLRRQYDDSVLERLALISMVNPPGFRCRRLAGSFWAAAALTWIVKNCAIRLT